MLSMKRNSFDETYENVIFSLLFAFFSAVDSDYATMKIFFAVKCSPKNKILPKDFAKFC